MVAVALFAFIAFIIFIIELFKKNKRSFRGLILFIFQGFLGFIVLLIILFIAIGISLYVMDLSEDTDFENRLDKQFKEVSNEDVISKENILIEIQKSGAFGRKIGRRGTRSKGTPAIHYYIKNYNDASFKGTITFSIIKNGKTYDEDVIDVELESGKLFSEYRLASEYNISKDTWRSIWDEAEIKYEIRGEFIK